MVFAHRQCVDLTTPLVANLALGDDWRSERWDGPRFFDNRLGHFFCVEGDGSGTLPKTCSEKQKQSCLPDDECSQNTAGRDNRVPQQDSAHQKGQRYDCDHDVAA